MRYITLKQDNTDDNALRQALVEFDDVNKAFADAVELTPEDATKLRETGEHFKTALTTVLFNNGVAYRQILDYAPGREAMTVTVAEVDGTTVRLVIQPDELNAQIHAKP